MRYTRTLILTILMTLAGSTASAHPDHADRDILEVYGDLRQIASNELDDARPYESFDPGPDLWGIGLPEGLDAELLVLGGRPFQGAFDGDRPAMNTDKPDQIVFFAYAHLKEWDELPIPSHVKDFDELAEFVEQVARAYGHDPKRGFPFRIEADAESVDWFVVRGMGDLQPNPLASFRRGLKLGTLGSRRIVAFGTYSSDLSGIASLPGTPIHLHFATDDHEPLFVGHINGKMKLSVGAILHLPKLPAR